jgi:hypothetical protein
MEYEIDREDRYWGQVDRENRDWEMTMEYEIDREDRDWGQVDRENRDWEMTMEYEIDRENQFHIRRASFRYSNPNGSKRIVSIRVIYTQCP